MNSKNDTIGIIDIGIGNSISIEKMIYSCGGKSKIITTPDDLDKFNKVILPGVGSFGFFMNKLKEKKFDEVLIKKINNNDIFILGICVGMQVLFETSQESKDLGLGILKGNIKKFDISKQNIKIPHNGFNHLSIIKESEILKKDDLDVRFYFNHSYYLQDCDEEIILSKTNYSLTFISSVLYKNILAVQFHPEKSHKYGKVFFKRFIEN